MFLVKLNRFWHIVQECTSRCWLPHIIYAPKFPPNRAYSGHGFLQPERIADGVLRTWLLWCSGVPTRTCIAGNGFVRRSWDKGSNLQIQGEGGPGKSRKVEHT